MTWDAIVIGGGAAGMFFAARAARLGHRILVLEHNTEPGRKILISGGGRCNFTNIHTASENFVTENPHFPKSAIAGYRPEEFVDLVRHHRIAYFEKKLGQLFCRESSRQIVQMLLDEMRGGKCRLQTGCKVLKVEQTKAGFAVDTSQGRFETGRLVVACGGLSFQKVGATDLAFRIARQFGLRVVTPRPGLVPLEFGGESPFRNLSGISVDSAVSTGKISFRENILFTHRGLSGPAILQISNYWTPDREVTVDLLPGTSFENVIRNAVGNRRMEPIAAEFLPNRVAESLFGKWDKPVAQLSRSEIESISSTMNGLRLRFTKTAGYDRAEVTAGGVSTAELSSQTMESKRVAGLYFIGEAVDVTGWLGGYNFQWAWSSANACANSL